MKSFVQTIIWTRKRFNEDMATRIIARMQNGLSLESAIYSEKYVKCEHLNDAWIREAMRQARMFEKGK